MGDIVLADRELDVMSVLWERGSGTVAEVRDALPDPLAYTTVLTVLRTLEEKGYVRHEQEGRAHRYFPAVERERVRRSALRRLVSRVFSGSPELAMAQLVSDDSLEADDLARIRRILEERLAAEDEDEGDGEAGR